MLETIYNYATPTLLILSIPAFFITCRVNWFNFTKSAKINLTISVIMSILCALGTLFYLFAGHLSLPLIFLTVIWLFLLEEPLDFLRFAKNPVPDIIEAEYEETEL